jgi:hypothetical protein
VDKLGYAEEQANAPNLDFGGKVKHVPALVGKTNSPKSAESNSGFHPELASKHVSSEERRNHVSFGVPRYRASPSFKIS